MTPSPVGPCRKEVFGGITPKRRHSQLKFFEGAPLEPPGHLPRLLPSIGGPAAGSKFMFKLVCGCSILLCPVYIYGLWYSWHIVTI